MRARTAIRPLGAVVCAVFVVAATAASAPVPGPPPGAAVAQPGVPATTLSSVTTEVAGRVLRVVLSGDGALVPRSIEEARDLPPRLVIDLPGVAPGVPAVIPVDKHELRRIRVAAHSRHPLVTRVVLDLRGKVSYRVEPAGPGGDVTVLLGESAGSEATAEASGAGNPPAADAATLAPAVSAPPARAARTGGDGAAAPSAGATTTPAADTPAVPAEAHAAVDPVAVAMAPRVETPGGTASPSSAAPAALAAPSVVPAPERAAAPAAAAEAAFSGHPVSLDFQGVDLRAVLRTFAEISGLNVVIDPAVNGTVDVSLREVPWDQALDIILRANQLGYSVDGTIVRIAPLTRLRLEEDEKRKLVEAKALSGDLQTVTRQLNYGKAAQMEPLLKNVLSTRGRTAVDLRTNTLVITELPEYLPRLQHLLDALDQPELQVEIEARIIQTTKDFARELGLRWGFNGRVAPELGNTTPLAFPHSGTLAGAVNVPKPPLPPPTGAIDLTLGSINGAFNIDLQLRALETEGKVRTLLTPRVVTQNNVRATITRGQEIPYTTTVAAPPPGGATIITPIPTVQFKTAALTLAVTPRITNANTVILEVDVDNGSPGQPEENGNRAINTQRAQTTVLVLDGATTVIGGIQATSEFNAQDKVPALHRLPVVGRLFRNDLHSVNEEEILIFITPKIIRVQ
jgi:type IV pilus assembly protein PilQ